MTQKARHTSGGMMLGQPVSCKNKRKPRVSWRREPIFVAGKPMHSRGRVARVKRVVYGRLKGLVVRWHRAIFQTTRGIKPPAAVFMQNKSSVAGNRIKAALVSGWFKTWRFLHRKIGVIQARPFALHLVPPDQFLAIAPRLTGRAGARPIIYNASITGPGEAPTVA